VPLLVSEDVKRRVETAGFLAPALFNAGVAPLSFVVLPPLIYREAHLKDSVFKQGMGTKSPLKPSMD
jgi:hypothetical protein